MLPRCLPIPEGSGGHEAGRMLLAEMYREYTGKELPPLQLGHRGKPYFADSPVHFSISHTRRHVFCALDDAPIGIDAEELDRDISPRLAKKILSSFEYAQYEAAEDKRLALLTFWVLKEAQGKCTGEGINGYPNHTHFSLDDPRVTIQNGCLLAVIKEKDHVV